MHSTIFFKWPFSSAYLTAEHSVRESNICHHPLCSLFSLYLTLPLPPFLPSSSISAPPFPFLYHSLCFSPSLSRSLPLPHSPCPSLPLSFSPSLSVLVTVGVSVGTGSCSSVMGLKVNSGLLFLRLPGLLLSGDLRNR